ncbi:MAG TPA: hypothetical protein VJU77_14950 [Chthoniobacterales bacterium]|nr:hypothetical protein [Chthoniobacterales bacterium]
MAADFIILSEHQVVFSYGWGILSFADLEEHRRRLTQDAAFDATFRQIANLTDVTEMRFSNDQIWSLAREPVLAPRSLRAVVAGDKQYGFARIFHGYSEGQNVRVFRQLKEAVDWLELSAEVADKAFAEIRQRHGLA